MKHLAHGCAQPGNLRRRLAVMLVSALAATLQNKPAASADTPGCVSSGEYYAIARGWTPKRVAALLDTTGTKIFDKTYSEHIPQAAKDAPVGT